MVLSISSTLNMSSGMATPGLASINALIVAQEPTAVPSLLIRIAPVGLDGSLPRDRIQRSPLGKGFLFEFIRAHYTHKNAKQALRDPCFAITIDYRPCSSGIDARHARRSQTEPGVQHAP